MSDPKVVTFENFPSWHEPLCRPRFCDGCDEWRYRRNRNRAAARVVGVELGGDSPAEPVRTCSACTAPVFKAESGIAKAWAWNFDLNRAVWAIEDRTQDAPPAECPRCRVPAEQPLVKMGFTVPGDDPGWFWARAKDRAWHLWHASVEENWCNGDEKPSGELERVPAPPKGDEDNVCIECEDATCSAAQLWRETRKPKRCKAFTKKGKECTAAGRFDGLCATHFNAQERAA